MKQFTFTIEIAGLAYIAVIIAENLAEAEDRLMPAELDNIENVTIEDVTGEI